MTEAQLRDSLFELVPPDNRGDWEDVLSRAGTGRARMGRLALAVVLAFVVMLAVGSALALSGQLGNLFHGTPVNDITPRERFLMSEFDMNGKVELIAHRNGLAFYVIRGADGRVCYSIGDLRIDLTPAQRAGRFRFGDVSCIDRRIFPSRAVPVLSHPFFSYRKGDSEARMAGLRGFAVDAVDRIGVIGRDNRLVFTLPVEHNVFSAGKRAFMGARGILALDDRGKVLWVQCFAVGTGRGADPFPGGGCGRYKNTPPPNFPARKLPRRPIAPPGPAVVQHGSGEGVTVDIRGSRITANFASVSPAKRALLVSKTGKITLGCLKLLRIGKQADATGTYSSKPFDDVVRLRPYNPIGPAPARAPFDACTAMGMFGHVWNDVHGTHDTIEIPLTARGRRYLAERAVARDIGWLARARVFRDIRYALRPFTSASAARWLGGHVVPMNGPDATPPIAKLGIWIGPDRQIVLAERAPTGHRFFFELRRGVAYRTNLTNFAQAF